MFPRALKCLRLPNDTLVLLLLRAKGGSSIKLQLSKICASQVLSLHIHGCIKATFKLMNRYNLILRADFGVEMNLDRQLMLNYLLSATPISHPQSHVSSIKGL